MKQKLVNANLGRFPKLRTGQLDYGPTSHFDKEIRLFPRIFDKNPPSPWTLFKIWLIWLDSLDQKWISHHEGRGLAGQFWQMESALSIW